MLIGWCPHLQQGFIFQGPTPYPERFYLIRPWIKDGRPSGKLKDAAGLGHQKPFGSVRWQYLANRTHPNRFQELNKPGQADSALSPPTRRSQSERLHHVGRAPRLRRPHGRSAPCRRCRRCDQAAHSWGLTSGFTHGASMTPKKVMDHFC